MVITPSTSAKASRFVIEEQAKFSANNTVFENSHAEGKNGGAIYNEGTLQIENSVDFVLPNKDKGGIDKY